MLRGGAFKPRTSPHDFQGLGVEGLRFLREAGDFAGMPVVTEIMSEDDIAAGCEYADMIQVGARNMQNFGPLKKLAKTRHPILLKRGASATIKEWLSAADYLLHGGNENVVLCERGIRTFDNSLRNTLDLAGVGLGERNDALTDHRRPVARYRETQPYLGDGKSRDRGRGGRRGRRGSSAAGHRAFGRSTVADLR